MSRSAHSLMALPQDTSGGSVKCDVGQLHGTVAKEIAVSMVVVNTSVSPTHNLREPAPYRRRRAEPCDLMGCIL